MINVYQKDGGKSRIKTKRGPYRYNYDMCFYVCMYV